MKRTAVIFYWLVLLASALAVGAGAFRLLLRERGRLETAGREAAQGGAQLLADEVALSVQELEQKLGENLAAIPPADRAATLSGWERNNPLIRNAFVLDARGAVVYPAPGEPMTGEQERFLRRYESLFSGRAPWTKPAEEQPAPYVSARQEFSRLAVAQKALSGSVTAGPETGWLAWYADNQVQLLGWAQDPADGTRYGVELEMAAVLSRLAPSFAGGTEPYALLDGEGRVVFQSGAIATGAVPVVTVPVGVVLPHWQVGAYASGGPAGAARGTFLLLDRPAGRGVRPGDHSGRVAAALAGAPALAGCRPEDLFRFERLARAQDAADHDPHVRRNARRGAGEGRREASGISESHRGSRASG